MWTALAPADRAVEVVVVGRDPVRLAGADRVLGRWTNAPAASGTEPERCGQETCHARTELDAVRAAVSAGDLAALEDYGGINGALVRMRELVAAGEAATARTKPVTTAGRTWRSRRVPEGAAWR